MTRQRVRGGIWKYQTLGHHVDRLVQHVLLRVDRSDTDERLGSAVLTTDRDSNFPRTPETFTGTDVIAGIADAHNPDSTTTGNSARLVMLLADGQRLPVEFNRIPQSTLGMRDTSQILQRGGFATPIRCSKSPLPRRVAQRVGLIGLTESRMPNAGSHPSAVSAPTGSSSSDSAIYAA
jgi:hypothetical protein